MLCGILHDGSLRTPATSTTAFCYFSNASKGSAASLRSRVTLRDTAIDPISALEGPMESSQVTRWTKPPYRATSSLVSATPAPNVNSDCGKSGLGREPPSEPRYQGSDFHHTPMLPRIQPIAPISQKRPFDDPIGSLLADMTASGPSAISSRDAAA